METLNDIHASIEGCTRCYLLSRSRNKIVFGTGSPSADLFIIGEAPGEEEDLVGEPFIGRAGKELDKWLKAIHQDRTIIYITNTVKCRPSDNRTPASGEQDACRPILLRQIEVVRPKVILTLGSPAIRAMVPEAGKITGCHGQVQNFNDIPLVPTFHPAAVLRARRTYMPQVINDLRILIKILYGGAS